MGNVNATATSVNHANGTEKQLYAIKDERQYLYPRFLLGRIIGNKKKNDLLRAELMRLKKMCNKIHQEKVARRVQSAVTISEPIEIS